MKIERLMILTCLIALSSFFSNGCCMWECVFGGETEIMLNDKQVLVDDLTRLHLPRGNDTVFDDGNYTVKGQEPVVIHTDKKKITLTTDASGITLTRGSGKPQYVELPKGQIIKISDEGVFFPEPEGGAPPPKKEEKKAPVKDEKKDEAKK